MRRTWMRSTVSWGWYGRRCSPPIHRCGCFPTPPPRRASTLAAVPFTLYANWAIIDACAVAKCKQRAVVWTPVVLSDHGRAGPLAPGERHKRHRGGGLGGSPRGRARPAGRVRTGAALDGRGRTEPGPAPAREDRPRGYRLESGRILAPPRFRPAPKHLP